MISVNTRPTFTPSLPPIPEDEEFESERDILVKSVQQLNIEILQPKKDQSELFKTHENFTKIASKFLEKIECSYQNETILNNKADLEILSRMSIIYALMEIYNRSSEFIKFNSSFYNKTLRMGFIKLLDSNLFRSLINKEICLNEDIIPSLERIELFVKILYINAHKERQILDMINSSSDAKLEELDELSKFIIANQGCIFKLLD